MNIQKIKQQLKDFRTTTPKHIQWLLLGAAFVIVVILLTLVLTRKSNDNKKIESATQQVSFDVTPTSIDLTDTFVGDTQNQNVTVTVNTPVVLDTISVDESDITTTNNCDNLIDSCIINVIYKPETKKSESETTLKITWHVLSQQDILQTFEIPMVYSAIEKEKPVVEQKIIEEKVVEKVEPMPVSTVVDLDDIEEFNEENEEYDEDEDYADVIADEPIIAKPEKSPAPIQQKIQKEIRAISKNNIFEDLSTTDEEFSLPPEKCSDFAIPGYNQSGVQIGWIKPDKGANYFHPFSDKDCSEPTGRYDFATGIITSLKDGSRIGTDANHIGYRNVRSRSGLSLPKLSSVSTSTFEDLDEEPVTTKGGKPKLFSAGDTYNNESKSWVNASDDDLMGSAPRGEFVVSSKPFDRTFILRQFKPIPATIVSEVRADPSVYGCNGVEEGECKDGENYSVPVRATVDRNVFSDDGRTIIIPTGTLLMGYLDGNLPGPYQSIGRMNIRWYQFIRPDGVEFNFSNTDHPYSGDAQGRMGVPGHGSTDYIEQMVMPILTSLVPAAVNMIAPIADTVINQIDLDNNTIVQSGTMRSSEMAKQEIIDTWNKVAQKLLVDVMANTTPPFSIAAGTRINVFSPVDLIVSCQGTGKKCDIIAADSKERVAWSKLKKKVSIDRTDPSWIGQVRSFDLRKYCEPDEKNPNKLTIKDDWFESGYDYRTVYAYCMSQNYQAINNAKNDAYSKQVQKQYTEQYGNDEARTDEQQKAYNQDILGLQYDANGNLVNPFAKPASTPQDIIDAEESEVLSCSDGSAPDATGCCPGEVFTDGLCCAEDAVDDPDAACFEPLNVQ